LICATKINYKAWRLTTAYQFARRAAGIGKENSFCWGNLANIEHELYRFEQAEFCIEQGLKVAKTKREYAFLRKIQAALFIQMGDWERAVRASRIALSLNDDGKNRANLGMALLGVGKWEEAWPLYVEISGRDKSSRRMQYLDEPVWDGSKGKSIVVYDTQGIGDCIAFASIIPDALKDVSVVMDVRPELAGLFKRSFPQATVYGSFSGLGNEVEQGIGEDWRAKHKIEASIGMDGLARFYRPSPESCPGTPYLQADPVRVSQWRETFKAFGKPVIGIAWSGGMEHTAAKYRRIELEQFLPLFRSVDAVWVSLQYKDAQKEIDEFLERHPDVDLRQYKEATITKDYDDTAALVAALDLTIAPPTSVVHLAGGLGAPCIAMKAQLTCWKFAVNLPFNKTNMTLVENRGDWDYTIADVAELVKKRFAC
jgi:tetratricopeptide (TPR) repeat protein